MERLQRGSTRERDVESRVQERDRDLVAQRQERELEMQLEDSEHEIMELRRGNFSSDQDEDDSFDHNSSRYLRELDKMRAENEELRR